MEKKVATNARIFFREVKNWSLVRKVPPRIHEYFFNHVGLGNFEWKIEVWDQNFSGLKK